MLNQKILLSVLGQLLFVEALMLAACVGVGFYYGERPMLSFGLPALLCFALSALLIYVGRGAKASMTRRDGFLIVSVTWVVFALFGTLPFLLSGVETRFFAAFYESMSGFTTTGATALGDIDSLPRSILFWRSLMHWVGGVGIIFFTIAILPNTNAGEQKMFSAEMTGLKIRKLHPRIRTTAHWIGGIYLTLTLCCAAALYLAGMSPFDAVNHAFSTLATGGFSTHTASIGFFADKPFVQPVLVVFMLLSGINFTLIYLFFIKHRFREVWKDGELRCFFGLLACGIVLCFSILVLRDGRNPLEALQTAVFQCVSVQTTTGFTSEDFMAWSNVSWIPMLALAVVGACAGSTTGGIKCVRVLTIGKIVRNEFRQLLHPHAVFHVRLGKTLIDAQVVRNIFAFLMCYILLAIVGTMILLSMNIPLLDSVSCCLTSLSNIGPGYGYIVGPTDSWGAFPDGALLLSSIYMLIGRLEIFAILLPFMPAFWQEN